MYHYDDFLAEVHVTKDQKYGIAKLPNLMPIGRIYKSGDTAMVWISDDCETWVQVSEDGGNKTASALKVECNGECSVKFFTGLGYWASGDKEYTNALNVNRTNGWAGGDGINSFNLTNGNDGYQADCRDTLFIFGDTLVNKVNANNERIEPVAMPNNTYALMKKDLEDIEFIVTRNKDGKPTAVLKPDSAVSEDQEWFWLQDGVVIGKNLFLSPLVIQPDETQPEGFQFKVTGVSMVEIPIEDGKPDFANAKQNNTKLYKVLDNNQYVGGIAYMPYHPDMGYANGDGYIYIYGYTSCLTNSNSTRLIVARTTPEKLRDTDSWTYYNGDEFVTGIEHGIPILDHVSCEMSVTPIVAGTNKGKFLAVFQYDVNSPYVAYAIGDTPWGPFGNVCKVYACDEKQRMDETVYTYNAKAHSHLSSPDSILVSYNVNSTSMEANCRIADIYRPRFIRLHDTTL